MSLAALPANPPKQTHHQKKGIMKTLILKLIITLALVLPATLQAYTYTNGSDIWTYTTNSSVVTITAYSGSGGTVTIPSAINELPVTGITYLGLLYSISYLTIPDSVTNISADAFGRCFNLYAINVVSSNAAYSSLGGVLFNKNQTTLIECPPGFYGGYSIPSTVTTIGPYAFDFSGVTSFQIPASVTNIATPAFTSLFTTAITVDPANAFFSSTNGVLFNKSQTTLLAYPSGLGGTYTIPAGIPNIGDYAFLGSQLSGITIPGSVTNIGNWAISEMANLTNVVISNGVISIGNDAFSDDAHVGNLTIPGSVRSIGDNAFASWASLTNLTISNGVASIGFNAFQGDSSLTSVTIPGSVNSIGEAALANCYSLTNITVDTSNLAYSSQDGVLFDKPKANLIEFPTGLGSSYVIPSSVTNILNFAFGYCTNLTEVTIPDSVTSIADYAFFYCISLTNITFWGNAPSPIGGVFFSVNASAVVYYLYGTAGWSNTFAGIPAVLLNPPVPTGGPNFGVQNNQFGFDVSGHTGQVVVVEAATNLFQPVWIPIWTNTLSGSSAYFSDPQWTNYPGRYYRLEFP